MSNSFTELQDWGSTSYTVEEGTHITFQTKKAKIDLLTNPYFKRMLFIDGVLQSTIVDEHIYHQALVKQGLGLRPQTRVLVAGGAEGATVREVNTYIQKNGLGVREIIMVDWDEELVKHMKEKESWAKGAFELKNLRVYHMDIYDYFLKNKNTYSTILLDLLDPDSEEDFHFLQEILELSLLRLEKYGAISINLGGEKDKILKKIKEWEEYFKSKIQITFTLEEINVPSFQQPWYLLGIRT